MDFYDVLDQVLDLLRQRGRVAYRVLKLQFKLDDETLEALKDELIYSQRLAVDAEGKVLVWVGDSSSGYDFLAAPGRSRTGAVCFYRSSLECEVKPQASI